MYMPLGRYRKDYQELFDPAFSRTLEENGNTVVSYDRYVKAMRKLYLLLKKKPLKKTKEKKCFWVSDKKRIVEAREMFKAYISNLVGFDVKLRFMPVDEYEALNECIIIERM